MDFTFGRRYKRVGADLPACCFLNLSDGRLESLPRVREWLHLRNLLPRTEASCYAFPARAYFDTALRSSSP